MHVQIQHNIDFTYINSFIWNSWDIIFDITLVHYIITFICINTCTYLPGFIHQVQQILVHPDRQELGLSVCCQLYTVGTVSGSVISFILKIIWSPTFIYCYKWNDSFTKLLQSADWTLLLKIKWCFQVPHYTKASTFYETMSQDDNSNVFLNCF